ncbi:hypothetical protein GCM10020254_76110 [Streptomyces goshikiensis]
MARYSTSGAVTRVKAAASTYRTPYRRKRSTVARSPALSVMSCRRFIPYGAPGASRRPMSSSAARIPDRGSPPVPKKPNSPAPAIRTTRSVEAMPWNIDPAT